MASIMFTSSDIECPTHQANRLRAGDLITNPCNDQCCIDHRALVAKIACERQNALHSVREAAKARHERSRKAAAARGRQNYPLLPFECSAAFETEFERSVAAGLVYSVNGQMWHSQAEADRFAWLNCP